MYENEDVRKSALRDARAHVSVPAQDTSDIAALRRLAADILAACVYAEKINRKHGILE
jgi:hypothetical protein